MNFGYSGLPILNTAGDDGVPKFEPTVTRRSLGEGRQRLKFEDLDKSIQELRVMYKAHPEWFEVPRPKSIKGKNEVDYSI